MSILAIALFSSLRAAAVEVLLANHLWQSTLFAAAAALITLILKKNSARLRYSLWLAASLKFLLPFSILTSLGSRLAWHKASALQQPVFVMVQQLSQPFPSAGTPQPVPQPPTTFASLVGLWPILLLLVWFCGCAVVLFLWWARWRRIMLSVRNAVPDSPRELEALRRVQTRAPATQVKLLVSQSAFEPGILGIFRPLLLLPAGIADRLSGPQLDAVITHELCHVRRRDNLAAALHMLVQALFWFHPFVWWIGARLLDERERACDEEVLSLGTQRQSYAEGILKICEFYLESPPVCSAGVTGSNLKKRIEAIMLNRTVCNLGPAKKLFLWAVGTLAVAGPVALGLLHAAQSRAAAPAQNEPLVAPAFEAVSIKPNTNDTPVPGFSIVGKPFSAVLLKPNRFQATNVSLQKLISVAFGLQESRIVGGPDWVNAEKYDVDATIGASLLDQLNKLGPKERSEERTRMLQALLTDRFKLALHRETRELPGYSLVVAQGGPKLKVARPGDTYSDGPKDGNGQPLGSGIIIEQFPGKLIGQAIPVAVLVHELSEDYVHRPVSDKTGLTGTYDFTLQWSPQPDQQADQAFPILAAIRDQLGLALESQNSPVEVLVIDQIQRPATDTSNIAPPQSAHPQSALASPATLAVSLPSKSFATQTQPPADNPITCAAGTSRYPEGTVLQMGDGPEQMCVRVLALVDPKNPDAPPKYAPQWIHTSKAIRERSAAVVHIPDTAPVPCSPKASTQKNLCACEGVGDFSQGALVNSAKGSFQLRCKEGKWLPTDRPNIQRN